MDDAVEGWVDQTALVEEVFAARPDLQERITALAQARGTTVNAVYVELLEAGLREDEAGSQRGQ